MKKLIRMLAAYLCLLCVCFGAAGCWFWGNFNGIMYKHFKDPNNYYEWTVCVEDFVWTDMEDGYTGYSLFDNSENFEYRALEERKRNHIALSVTILEYEKEWMSHLNKQAFEIDYQNAVELIKNGFLENVRIGETIKIRATYWTYGDRDWFFLAAVECGDVTYLDIDTGIKNIVAYMDDNRSLL